MSTQTLRIEKSRIPSAQHFRENDGTLLIEENAGNTLDDRLERAAAAERDRGCTCGRGLERNQPKIFFTRNDNGASAGDKRRYLSVRNETKELRRRTSRALLQRPSGGAFTGNKQLYAGERRSVDSEIDALVGQQSRQDEEIIAATGCGGRLPKSIDIHRTRQDERIATIITPDAFGDVTRIRDKRGRPHRRAPIPGGKRRHEGLRQAADAESADVVLVRKKVAAWSVDVRNMNRTRSNDYPFCPRRRGAHDQIVWGKVEFFEC